MSGNQQQGFDVNAFLQESLGVSLDTQRLTIPKGEYTAQIDTGDKAIDLQFGTISKQGSKNFGKPWARLDVKCVIPDPNLAATLKVERPVVRASIMLDLDANGKIDTSPQRNIRLGKLLEACGQNNPQGSIAGCAGKAVKIMVNVVEEDGKDPYNEVTMFAPAL